MTERNDESCGNCDRVFGTRINYLEEQISSLKQDLRAVNDRESRNSSNLTTKLAVMDTTMKLWVTMGGVIVGVGSFVLDKIWK